MKQVQRVLSTYSVDLFGVCSALYELGGLIVMHDASGCNSTYNTHDEPRWYDMDSMVYVSGLRETDAILGNDDRLIDDICEAAFETHPKFIAVSGSPVTSLMGTDFRGIGRLIEKKTGIPTIAFKTGCMNTYVIGAGQAFREIVERFCLETDRSGHRHQEENADSASERSLKGEESTTKFNDMQTEEKSSEKAQEGDVADKLKVNLFGVTPLDFSIVGNVEALKKYITDCGFELCCCLAMGDTLENISNAGNADVTLVVSSTGLPAAELLKERFGVPYVVGIPIGKIGSELIKGEIIDTACNCRSKENLYDLDVTGNLNEQFSAVSINASDGMNEVECAGAEGPEKSTDVTMSRDRMYDKELPRLYKDALTPTGDDTWIIGEPVFAASLRRALEEGLGFKHVRIICPMEKDAGVLRSCDVMTCEEDEIGELISGGKMAIADPIYRRIVSPESSVKFIDFPHEAYSGRIYRDEIPVFIGQNVERWFAEKLKS